MTRSRIRIVTLVFSILCGMTGDGVVGVKIVGVSIPTLADLRRPTELGCSYDTERDALFSVKWYKDDHEFFRYMPSHEPSVLTFPFEGATLANSNSETCGMTRCDVTLDTLTPLASGAYSCEVSTEAPTFRTVVATRNMTVAAFPLEEPRIEGLRAAYTIGDVLDVTCKSAPSAPPARLTVFVNNEEVEQKEISRTEVGVHEDLSSTSARVRMVLSREHFAGGAVRVVCSAALAKVPAPVKSSAAMAMLARDRFSHNQKFEWPNSADKKTLSTTTLFLLLSLQHFRRLLFM